MPTQHIAEILAGSDVFSGAVPDHLGFLASKAQVFSFKVGHEIFATGDPSEALFVVLEGRVRIIRLAEDGQEIGLGFIDAGSIFGEISMLDGKGRSASAVAYEKCRLGVIRRSDFFSFLDLEPENSRRLLLILCGRLRDTIDQVHSIGLKGVEARVARTLLWLASNYGKVRDDGVLIDIKLGQREVGTFAATSRESVSKAFGLWREAGHIDRAGNKLLIRDREALARLAGSSSRNSII